MRYWYDTEFDEDGETIILISIGIICEDGRELDCVSNEFDPDRPNDWVKENFLPHLPPRDDKRWMSKEQIKHKVLEFFAGDKKPELWADYGAYDWVVFSQLFGKMIDKPKKFPFNSMDTKQWWKQLGEPQLPEQVGTEHSALDDAKHSKAKWEALNKYSMRVKESANHYCQMNECFMPAVKRQKITGQIRTVEGKILDETFHVDARLCLAHAIPEEGDNPKISMSFGVKG